MRKLLGWSSSGGRSWTSSIGSKIKGDLWTSLALHQVRHLKPLEVKGYQGWCDVRSLVKKWFRLVWEDVWDVRFDAGACAGVCCCCCCHLHVSCNVVIVCFLFFVLFVVIWCKTNSIVIGDTVYESSPSEIDLVNSLNDFYTIFVSTMS